MPKFKAVFHGEVREGVLDRLPDLLRACRAVDGRKVVVTLEEAKKRRSNNQNAYMWGVVIPVITEMLRDFGNNVSPEETHEFLKVHVGKLIKEVTSMDGKIRRIPGTTTTLSTLEMENYLEKCRAFAAENGCVVPLPNEW